MILITQTEILKKSLIMMIILFLSALLVSCNESITTTDYSQVEVISIKRNEEFMQDLSEMIEELSEMNSIYNLSISYKGEIINETHFNDVSEGRKFNVFSVTKSVTSLLIGIAIDNEFIGSVEDTIEDYIDLSEYEVEPEVASITIHNLMTMSDGLYWNSNDLAWEMINLRSTNTPLKNILEREITSSPGTRFNYSDGASHLMSVILAEATNMSTFEFAIEYLFNPLGIFDTSWRLDMIGYNIGGCDLQLASSDMNKIGNLVLNEGVYEGNRIVSKEWLELSTTNQIGSYASFDYGYYWWLSETSGYDIISARGWGGQLIYIVPDFNLVVTTSSNGNISSVSASNNYVYLEDMIVNGIISLFIEELD